MKAKKLVCLLLAVLLTFTASACSLTSLNEEKDAASVVAVVNGSKILKSSFNDFYETYCLLYQIYGNSLPTDEAELKTFKENIFDSYIYDLCCYEEAKAAGVTPEDGAADTLFDNMMLAGEYYLGSEESLDALLSENGLDRDGFKALSEEYRAVTAYTNAYNDTEPDYSAAMQGTALKVNGKDISVTVFDFYALTLMLFNYVSYNTYPSSDDDFLNYYDSTVSYVSNTQALIDYADEQGFTISDEEAKAKFDDTFAALTDTFGEDYLLSFYKSYYLSEADIEAGKLFIGKGFVAEDRLQEQLEAEMTVTEEEVTEYYNSNSASFAATVSCYYILTEDEVKARQLEKEAGGTAEGFMALYDKIKAAEGTDAEDADIKQAYDLGAFKYSSMSEAFSVVAFAMAVGEVKGMVSTDDGYHLIYKYAETPAPTLADNYDEIAAKCKTSAVSTAKTEKLNEIADSAKTTEKDYRKTTHTRLQEYLYDKYNVKTYPKRALR